MAARSQRRGRSCSHRDVSPHRPRGPLEAARDQLRKQPGANEDSALAFAPGWQPRCLTSRAPLGSRSFGRRWSGSRRIRHRQGGGPGARNGSYVRRSGNRLRETPHPDPAMSPLPNAAGSRRHNQDQPREPHQSIDELLARLNLDSDGRPRGESPGASPSQARPRKAPSSITLVVRSLRWSNTEPFDTTTRLSAVVHDLVDKDANESRLLLTLADDRPIDEAPSAEAFHMALMHAISLHRLHRLFTHGESGAHHRGVVPGGYSERTGETFPHEMAAWRAEFRAMAPEQQMLAATIVWLYQSGPDSTWLRRVPCTWPATEAIQYMRDAGCIRDWLRLVALCPGW